MSETSYRDIEKGDKTDRQARSPPNHSSQSLQGGLNTDDNSWPIFSMYSKMAEEEDNKLAERWQKDADGMLIFTGLFSAVVAAFTMVSVQDLKPNSQDISAFYLQKIDQRLEGSNTSIPVNLANPPAFSPSNTALWVNSLWFLSLTMSLSCAVMATFLQQWGRRYLKITQPSACSPEKRARMRALYAGSTGKLLIKILNAVLPCVLHFSLLLFFIGLLVFLFQFNHIVVYCIIWWIGFSILLYGIFTILPLFYSDGLLYTPVSSLFGILIAFMACLVLTFTGDRFGFRIWKSHGDIMERDFERLFGDLCGADDEYVSKLESEIDVRVLEWTIDALGEDNELEKFFDDVPGFFNSKPENHLLRNPPDRIRDKFQKALNGFLDRTFSSNTVSESVRNTRLVICLNAAHAAPESYPVPRLLQVILGGRWREALHSLNVGQSLRRWSNTDDEVIALRAQSLIARIVINVRERDDRWIALVKDEFGIADDVLQDYAVHGDSLSLAILVHFTRRLLRSNATPWDPSIFWVSSCFDICSTLPGPRQDFCTLWNELVREAREGGRNTPVMILKSIRHLYIALHQGTDASPTAFSASTTDNDPILDQPSSYPLCQCQDTTPQMHSSQMGEPSQFPTAASLTFSHRDPDPFPVAITSFHDPDISLPDPSDTLQSVTAAATLYLPLEGNQQNDIAAPRVAPHNSEVSPNANPISASVPTRDATLQRNEETSVVPPIVPDFHLSHSLGPPSSPQRSHIATSIVEARDHVNTGVGAHVHDETHDLYPLILMEVPRHVHQSVSLSASDIDERPGYGQHGQNWL